MVVLMKTIAIASVSVSSTTFAFGPSSLTVQLGRTNSIQYHSATTLARTASITTTPSTSKPPLASFRSRSSSPLYIATNDEVKDPSTLISAQNDETQQKTFALICGGVLTGSLLFLQLYNALEIVLPEAIFAPF